jgi:hypothetical protein
MLSICILTFLFNGRACYGVLRFVMESGAKGCEVSLVIHFLMI